MLQPHRQNVLNYEILELIMHHLFYFQVQFRKKHLSFKRIRHIPCKPEKVKVSLGLLTLV